MAQSFTDIMSQIRGGFALHEAGKKLQELVTAVRATNKAGEITFTIKVAPDKTDDRVITMKPSIKCKIPDKGFSEGIFFIGPDGRITKEDPAQVEMFSEREKNGIATIGGERPDAAALAKVGTGNT